jgi:hypothetical protein
MRMCALYSKASIRNSDLAKQTRFFVLCVRVGGSNMSQKISLELEPAIAKPPNKGGDREKKSISPPSEDSARSSVRWRRSPGVTRL